MVVCSFTPSRMGIISAVRVKRLSSSSRSFGVTSCADAAAVRNTAARSRAIPTVSSIVELRCCMAHLLCGVAPRLAPQLLPVLLPDDCSRLQDLCMNGDGVRRENARRLDVHVARGSPHFDVGADV